MESYDHSESFIITQDPMEDTIADFWRMISEQSINTIVMISEVSSPRFITSEETFANRLLVHF